MLQPISGSECAWMTLATHGCMWACTPKPHSKRSFSNSKPDGRSPHTIGQYRRHGTSLMPAEIAKRLKAFVAGRTDGPVFLAHENRVSMRHAQRRLSGWF